MPTTCEIMTAPLRYLSVCSGIEAASVAWQPRGWEAVAFSEIDKSASRLLAHKYPETPNWGDMSNFKEWPDATVDVLCGGTPCQSFSVAGLRKGLADPRGNLALTYLAIAAKYRPRWICWENVPGVYSATSHVAPDQCPPGIDLDGGDGPKDGEEIVVVDEYEADESHAFACFVAGLQELGYGVAYRTLDAQHVRTCRFPLAVPQRRRRVFVVGHLGDWRRAAAVLFDRESLSGHPAPRRKAGQGFARGIEFGPSGGGFDAISFGAQNSSSQGDGVHVEYCATLDKSKTPAIAIQERAICENPNAGPDGAGVKADGSAYTLEARTVPQAVAFVQNTRDEVRLMGGDGAMAGALAAEPGMKQQCYIAQPMEVRDADAYEADASSALSTLRDAVGAKAYAEWGLAVLAAFQSPEILRDWLLGGSLKTETEEARSRVDDRALSRPQHSAGRLLLNLWISGPDGRSPQGRGVAKQLAGKPGEALSVLPHKTASAESDMHHLREASEGARLLREALSAVQAMGRSTGNEDQPAHAPWAVRRLTPREAERLQGFPDDYTQIPNGNKPTADGPRYKQLGNSWAINCIDWLGERIAEVDQWAGPATEQEAANG